MVVLSLMLVMLPLLHPLVDDVLLLLVVPMVYLVVSVYLSSTVMSACVPIACLLALLSAGRNNFSGIAIGEVGKFHGYTLIVSSSCLSYLSGMICLRIVLALMTLPGMPTIDSPVVVSLPSQIPLKNLGSILGCAFCCWDHALYCFCHLA